MIQQTGYAKCRICGEWKWLHPHGECRACTEEWLCEGPAEHDPANDVEPPDAEDDDERSEP